MKTAYVRTGYKHTHTHSLPELSSSMEAEDEKEVE